MRTKLRERFSYWFDNYMASGAWSIFMALLVIFLLGFVIITIGRIIVAYFFPETINLPDTWWRIFLELTDPGNMNQDNDSIWYMKIFTVISGVFGIVFFSAVIAFITTQLDLKFEQLKKGKSRVLEKDHILILGWTEQVVEIIRELIIANESESKASVVVLSSKEKEEMDDFINDNIFERKTTKIITRSGETSSLNALKRVGIDTCKSIIILPVCSSFASNEEKILSDAHTLKTLLAVIAATQERDTQPEIVTQVYFDSNKEIMLSLNNDSLTIVDPEDIVAKIAVQTSRSSGLAAVYAELIGFDGCEFYITKSKWKSRKFGEIQYHYPDGIAMGIREADNQIIMNPDPEYVLKDDDSIIILAEDDSTINFKNKQLYFPRELPFVEMRKESKIEKELIIGWNNKGKIIIEQYVDYILEGSIIEVVLPEDTASDIIDEIEKLNKKFDKHKINILKLSKYNIQSLANLSPETYNSIIILNTVSDDLEKADAATINILLMLRAAIKKRTEETGKTSRVQIISEVMNSDNLELISHTGVNDAIISTKMVSKILAQVAEEPDTLKIYDEIFEEEGSEIYLKPLSLYLKDIPEKIIFADLILLAQKRSEICIGYRCKKNMNNVDQNFGVILNPGKDSEVELTLEDSIIVLAEDDL